ncbi:MAG: hypothetical protein FWG74_07380 [Planctomycetes bacterium]|nr:hypothetical protein [Planctomycetota bacterium]
MDGADGEGVVGEGCGGCGDSLTFSSHREAGLRSSHGWVEALPPFSVEAKG